MDVLLVNPPRINELIGNNPSIMEEERGFNPPLGLLYLAGFIEKKSCHRVQIIDAQVEDYDYAGLEAAFNESDAQVVGITTMTLTMRDVIKTIHTLKKSRLKNAKIVLGGPHVQLYPEESIRIEGVDFLICGEGEHSFCKLLDALENDSDLSIIPGVVYRTSGQIVQVPVEELLMNLDELPFPARHLLPYKKYNSLLSKGGVVTTIFTSRGCPFQCTYCDRPHFGKTFRARSARNVVDELKECYEMGIKEFLFYDDTFTVDKNRAIDICNLIVEEKLDISFDIRARVDTINDSVLKALKKAGCCGINYGIEAGTEKILKILNKKVDLQTIRSAVKQTKENNIPVLAYLMIGCPSETLEDIEQTFKLTAELDPDYMHLAILSPFPGTEIYKSGLESGLFKSDVWRTFAKDPMNSFVVPHWGENFTRAELLNILNRGYRSFYLRPGYILKRLRALSSWKEFVRKAKAGLKVFFLRSR